MITADTGYILGDNNSTFQTTNKGDTWNPYGTGFSNNYFDITFNGKTGYIAGGNGRVYRTDNFGRSWREQIICEQSILSVHIFDSLHICTLSGILVGETYLTTNGGENWAKTSNILGSPANMSFLDDTTGLITGYDVLFRSNDAGRIWNSLSPIVSGGDFWITLINRDFGFSVGKNAELVRLSDNFSKSEQKVINEDLNDIEFFDDKTGLLRGDFLYKTTDKGKTWKKVLSLNQAIALHYPNLGFRLDAIKVLSSSEALAAVQGPMYEILVFKTENQGKTWSRITVGQDNSTEYQKVNAILAVSEDSLYIINKHGLVFFSDNGGEFFDELSQVGENIFRAILDKRGNIWAMGQSLWKSTDGGRSFEVSWQWAKPTDLKFF